MFLSAFLKQAQKNKSNDYIREVIVLMDLEDCIKAVVAYTDAEKSSDIRLLEQICNVIIEKAAKILIETQQAEYNRNQNWISQNSLLLFSKTLQKVVNVIQTMPNEAPKKIFDAIPEKALQVLDERRAKLSQNQLVFFINDWWQISWSIAKDKKQNADAVKNNLYNILQQAMTILPQQQYPQKLSQLSTSELSKFLEDEIQDIRQEFNSVLERATYLLVDGQIVHTQFQLFIGIWRFAIGRRY